MLRDRNHYEVLGGLLLFARRRAAGQAPAPSQKPPAENAPRNTVEAQQVRGLLSASAEPVRAPRAAVPVPQAAVEAATAAAAVNQNPHAADLEKFSKEFRALLDSPSDPASVVPMLEQIVRGLDAVHAEAGDRERLHALRVEARRALTWAPHYSEAWRRGSEKEKGTELDSWLIKAKKKAGTKAIDVQRKWGLAYYLQEAVKRDAKEPTL